MTAKDRNRILAAQMPKETICTCGARIIQARTSGGDGHKNWTPNEYGTWWLHPVTGVMRPLDPDDQGDFYRFSPHSCILHACNPDETDQ
jgi:hypothetical protein